MTERTLPADLTAEEALVGAMLLTADAVQRASDIVSAGDFYKPAHGHTFAAAVALWRNGVTVDPVTVAAELADRRQLDAVGGPGALVSLLAIPSSPAAADRYARIVAEKAALRRLVHVAGDLAERAYEGTDATDVLDWLTAQIAEVDVPLDGLPVGISSVDDFLARPDVAVPPWVVPGLFRRGWRVMLVAEEGVGKSVIGRQVALAASQGQHPFTGTEIAPVTTLVVDFENPDDVIADGFALVVDPLKAKLGDRYRPHQAWLWSQPAGVNLRTRTGRGQLEAAVAALRPDIVCLGPLYKAFRKRGADREQWDDVALEVTEVFDSLRTRYGFALFLEHHAPKKQGGVREMIPFGSGVWQRWPELGLTLVRDPKLNAANQHDHFQVGKFRLDRVGHAWPVGLSRAVHGMPWEARWEDSRWQDQMTEEAPF